MVAGISPSTPHGFIRVVTNLARSGEQLSLDTAGARRPSSRFKSCTRGSRGRSRSTMLSRS